MGAYSDLKGLGDINADVMDAKKASRMRIWLSILTVMLVAGFGGAGWYMYTLQEENDSLKNKIDVNLTQAIELIKEANSNYTRLFQAINETAILANENQKAATGNAASIKTLNTNTGNAQTQLDTLQTNTKANVTAIDASMIAEAAKVAILQGKEVISSSQVAKNVVELTDLSTNLTDTQGSLTSVKTEADANNKSVVSLSSVQKGLQSSVATNTANIQAQGTLIAANTQLSKDNEQAFTTFQTYTFKSVVSIISDLQTNMSGVQGGLASLVESTKEGLLYLNTTKLSAAGLTASAVTGTVNNETATATCTGGFPVGVTSGCGASDVVGVLGFTTNSVTVTCPSGTPNLKAVCISVKSNTVGPALAPPVEELRK